MATSPRVGASTRKDASVSRDLCSLFVNNGNVIVREVARRSVKEHSRRGYSGLLHTFLRLYITKSKTFLGVADMGIVAVEHLSADPEAFAVTKRVALERVGRIVSV